jgi:hypothetical protein
VSNGVDVHDCDKQGSSNPFVSSAIVILALKHALVQFGLAIT